MRLATGTRLGPYEITGPIGAGGMGEVYRARDTALNREVALKVLPESFAGDPDRLMRFKREAQTLAALNHPHIAQIYGLEEGGTSASPSRALVMELVEGEDLSQRIRRGSIPLDEALPIARQIAEALEAAHAQGIVHRDLKPANIKVRPDGVVKVLDFGLAKAVFRAEAVDGTDTVANSPTMTAQGMTRAGVILGTAAYMSPEQTRGRAVDARTDIWAFGCVLFEMLGGRSPFQGETVTDMLGAILHREPQWSLLPGTLPEALRRLLARCLAKDQKERLHSIADVRLEIQDVFAGPRSTGDVRGLTIETPNRAGMTRREGVAWGLVVVLLVAAARAAALLREGSSSASDESPALRLSMLHTEGGEVGVPAISPDGRQVAYSARRADGMPLIWIRDLDQSTPKSLAGTEGGNRLFWSPDSKRLGFVVGDVMKHISAGGGPVQEVARRVGGGAAWIAGDLVLYSGANGQIERITASGGQAVPATTLQGPDWGHYWPSALPDGRHFLFTAKHWAGLAETGEQGIYLGSIDNPSDIHRLLPELSSAVYAPPGFVIFARDGQLMAAAFDLSAGRVTSEPIALGEPVAVEASSYMAGVSVAADGRLAIRPPPARLATSPSGSGAFDAELTLLKRDGSVVSRFGGVQRFDREMALSPDGRTVVAQVQDAHTSAAELWRFDADSGARMALTSMRTAGGYASSPVWSPDGARLAFACQLRGRLDDVCVRDMQNGAVVTVVDSEKVWEHPVAWSPDGQYLLVSYDEFAGSGMELRVWSARTRTLSPFVKDAQNAAVFSPDARFVAFSSSDTGRVETYVTTFPDRRRTWPLTTDGGEVLSWSADGKEILVGTLTGHVAAYPVNIAGGSFSAGASHVIIHDVGFDVGFARATRDHMRVLVRVPKGTDKDRGEIRLLLGWARRLGTVRDGTD